jgi:hypothetical protein
MPNAGWLAVVSDRVLSLAELKCRLAVPRVDLGEVIRASGVATRWNVEGDAGPREAEETSRVCCRVKASGLLARVGEWAEADVPSVARATERAESAGWTEPAEGAAERCWTEVKGVCEVGCGLSDERGCV